MNTANREKFTANAQISTQLNPQEYIFINSYNRQSNRGSGYLYQKFDKNKKLLYQINAMETVSYTHLDVYKRQALEM